MGVYTRIQTISDKHLDNLTILRDNLAVDRQQSVRCVSMCKGQCLVGIEVSK